MATKPAGTVLKAFELLELFELRTTLSVSQCALLMDVPRATAHRLLVSLEAAGMLQRSDDRHYELGLRLFELGSSAPLRRLYSDRSRVQMQRLSHATGMPVHLAVRDHTYGILVDVVPGARYTLPTRVGLPVPLHSTALGKLLLANAPDGVFDDVVAGGLQRYTRHTIHSDRHLSEELERIRVGGLSYDREETHYGMVCMAAPIRARGSEIRAALSVSFPADSRETKVRAYRNQLFHVRDRIEAGIGPRSNGRRGSPDELRGRPRPPIPQAGGGGAAGDAILAEGP